MLHVTSSVGFYSQHLSKRSSTLYADHVIGPHGILATKARILVTNSIAFIKQFDQIIFIRRGIILESGPYQTLIANPEGELSKLVCVVLFIVRSSVSI